MWNDIVLLIDSDRQDRFALLSGDYNPLHVDPLQARRSQFGGCVVHGLHIVLAALDSLDLGRTHRIVTLDAQFRSAVLVGEAIWTRSSLTGVGEYRIDVGVAEQTRTTVSVALATAEPATVDSAPLWPVTVASSRRVSDLTSAGGSAVLGLDVELVDELFPTLRRSVIDQNIAVLLSVTRVVGMQCPGQWALFRRLMWSPAESTLPADTVHWAVEDVNERYSMIRIGLHTAGISARAEVIVREPPPPQPRLAAVRDRVDKLEFDRVRALVVGASRGLGELATKLVAAGSASVLITYNAGEDDARRVADEVGDTAAMIRLAVESPSDEAAQAIRTFAPTHVLYFATPTIAKQPSGTFDSSVYDRLQSVYASGLARVLDLAQAGGALRAVFYPSTVYVETHPTGFAEYIAAKLAGEAICHAWQDLHPDQFVVVDRLPPLVTDQTAAKLGSNTESNVEILLAALRNLPNGSKSDISEDLLDTSSGGAS